MKSSAWKIWVMGWRTLTSRQITYTYSVENILIHPYSSDLTLPYRKYTVSFSWHYVYKTYKKYISYGTEIIFLPKPGLESVW